MFLFNRTFRLAGRKYSFLTTKPNDAELVARLRGLILLAPQPHDILSFRRFCEALPEMALLICSKTDRYVSLRDLATVQIGQLAQILQRQLDLLK